MIRLPTRATRTYQLFPYTMLFRSRRFEHLADTVRDEILVGAQLKALDKQRKHDAKSREKLAKKGQTPEKPRVYTLRFHGDMQASAVESLRAENIAVLQIARPGQDEVLTPLDSDGGLVHGYGLDAWQLARLRH